MKHTHFSTFLASLALALAAPGVLAQSGSAAPSEAGAQQFTLKNGMTLIVKPDRRAPTAVHMLWVRVGAMDEVERGFRLSDDVLRHKLLRLPDDEAARRGMVSAA